MWQEKNMVRQYGQNKMKNIREISVGAILYRHFYFLKVSPKQRPYEDAFSRICLRNLVFREKTLKQYILMSIQNMKAIRTEIRAGSEDLKVISIITI